MNQLPNEKSITELHALYVNPAYQATVVGSRLLSTAEAAIWETAGQPVRSCGSLQATSRHVG